MTIEIWGTFSVRDHLVDRAFVADVLLYDRLVIPTKPKDAPDDKWPASWNLARQTTLLNDLGDLAIPIPWDQKRIDEWQTRFDDARSEERRLARAEATDIIGKDVALARDPKNADLPFNITRKLLQDFANAEEDNELFRKLRVTRKVRPGSVLEAVSAYPSFAAFSADVEAEATAEPSAGKQRLNPAAVFGWRFFVPCSDVVSEEQDRILLKKAIKLAKTNEFIERREDLYKWWSDVAASGMPAIEAREDMGKRLVEFQKLMKKQAWKTVARYALKIADAVTGKLGLTEFVTTGTDLAIGSTEIFADERLTRQNMPARVKVAAAFHDARKRLGWKGDHDERCRQD
jgi:hypothetical protein